MEQSKCTLTKERTIGKNQKKNKLMITAEDIRKIQRQEPFTPFTIYMSDGRQFEIKHPEFLMVFRNNVVIGVPNKDNEIPERSEICSILHITGLNMIAA